MMNSRMSTSKGYLGAELEQSYAELVDGIVSGGFNDGGKDVTPRNRSVPAFQVKSSIRGAVEFLARSIRFRRYIPICIGEPPSSRDELVSSLLEKGGWVGHEVPGREEALKGIEIVRRLCGAPD